MKNLVTLEIKRLNSKIHRAVSNRCREMNIDITPVQARLLMFISEHEEVSATDILQELKSINKSTLSEILNSMEKNSLVIREESSIDSRKKILKLTSKSKEIVDKMRNDFDSINKTALEGITKEEYATFKVVLDKIERNIEKI
ncbi:MAG: winged helix-turn-helix transcriptional regulator [Bacilli bacterium]|nr:winged helix-turn-helix transcriptional regulator [Bacilli bacterium]